MTTWISLTEDKLNSILTASQRETVAARPDKSSSNDPLSLALLEVVDVIRDAIRMNEDNILSGDSTLLPPELVGDAAVLVAESLEGRIPGFILSDSQGIAASSAASTLGRVRSGTLPVSIPESAPGVRRSFGPEVLHKRDSLIRLNRLRGL